MNKILIALDYNDDAMEIAATGYRLAIALKAIPVLLHAVPEASFFSSLKYSPIMGFDNFNNVDASETDRILEANRIAHKYLERTKVYLGDDSIETLVQKGDASEIILETARELKVELIVMGTHHKTGIDKLFSGSVAEKVLHQTNIPVLIIPFKND